MRCSEWLPAGGIVGAVLLFGLVPTVFPTGTRLVLVPVGPASGVAALDAAASVDAALVTLRPSGFAVLYGDAARIRARFGFAIAWQGERVCG